MSAAENPTYNHKRITSTSLIKNGPGVSGGFLVAASSSGTITLYDSTDNSQGLMVNAVPLTAGQWYPFPGQFTRGLYAVIGGTADISYFYN
jgi:hypothetical protein